MARLSSEDGAAAFSEMGAGDNVVRGVDTHGCIGRLSRLRHRPKREIWMLMDNEKNDVLLKAGTMLLFSAEQIAWANRGLNLVLLCLFL